MINICKELLDFLIGFVNVYRLFTATFIICMVLLLVGHSKKGG